MKTYQEYLAENGATPEEIAVLATPKAIKAYDKIQADAEAARVAAVESEKAKMDSANQSWWDTEYSPKLAARDKQIVDLAGENARIKAQLQQAKELGLDKIAIDAGAEPANPANPNPANPAGFDPKKYVSVEDFQAAFDKTGEAITMAQTLAADHFKLFGEHLIDFEDLRKAAVASRGTKTIKAIWEEKYKVSDKRKELADKAQKEHDEKIAKETEARIRAEYSANPMLGVPKTSRNSFTTRALPEKGKELWDSNGVPRGRELQQERVKKYAGKVM